VLSTRVAMVEYEALLHVDCWFCFQSPVTAEPLFKHANQISSSATSSGSHRAREDPSQGNHEA